MRVGVGGRFRRITPKKRGENFCTSWEGRHPPTRHAPSTSNVLSGVKAVSDEHVSTQHWRPRKTSNANFFDMTAVTYSPIFDRCRPCLARVPVIPQVLQRDEALRRGDVRAELEVVVGEAQLAPRLHQRCRCRRGHYGERLIGGNEYGSSVFRRGEAGGEGGRRSDGGSKTNGTAFFSFFVVGRNDGPLTSLRERFLNPGFFLFSFLVCCYVYRFVPYRNIVSLNLPRPVSACIGLDIAHVYVAAHIAPPPPPSLSVSTTVTSSPHPPQQT